MVWLTVAVILICLYLYSLRFFDAPISAPVRACLTAFRLGFLVFLLFLLTMPETKETSSIVLPPTLYVVADDSLSMNASVEPDASVGAPTRWDEVQKSLNGGEIARVFEDNGFNLRYATLSGLLQHRSGAWSASFPADASPAAPFTDLSAVVRSFQRAASKDESACLLMFTDGQWNQGGKPLPPGRGAEDGASSGSARGVYAFGVGPVVEMFDLRVDRFDAPSRLRANETAPLRVTLSVQGEAPGEPVETVLRVLDADGNEVYSDSRSAAFPTGGAFVTLDFTSPALPKGEYTLRVEAAPAKDESDTDNNRAERRLTVAGAKEPILLVTSAPDWEFKFLKRALEENEALDVQAYLEHDEGLLRLGDRAWVANQAGEEPGGVSFANWDELLQSNTPWSVVVVHNMYWSARNEAFAQWLRGYVENGGGVLNLPGANNRVRPAPSLQKILPPPLVTADELQSVLAVISPESAGPEALRAALNRGVQSPLPPVGPLLLPEERPAGARSLLKGGGASGGESVDLILQYRFGLGTIVASQCAGFWRINLLSGPDAMHAFWTALLYQCNPRLRGEQGEIVTDQSVYNLYDPVHIAYAAPDVVPSGTSSGLFVTVKSPSRSESVWLTPAAGDTANFQGQYTVVESGDYEIADPVTGASTAFQVEASAAELSYLRQNVEGLRTLAEESGGAYANRPAWKELAEKIPNVSRRIQQERAFFLGEKWWAATLLIALLGVEWFVRWRQGLP
ncbi:MAG: hypothetical protein GC154_16240 [bacterium]|nr:hypothetical protein [bacterium]